ncbi:DNA topoisomerase IB [Salinisphaera sp. T31B1]|uniref:DNA topoisomerase IB n=1 Tax=Salinisphaera sp. T31B1 TaxID=727963 RepID=UPI00334069B9
MASQAKTVARLRWGKGFTYRYTHGRNKGRTLKDARWRDWIAELVIPPAWHDVEITLDPKARVLASGRDDAGRKQYIYNSEFTAAQQRRKFDRLTQFAQQLSTMRRVTGQHLRQPGFTREKVLACMVRLIDMAYFRPGSERYLRENDSYGLTTMRSRHLRIEGDELIFDYDGKSGQHQHRVVEDRRLARVVAELDAEPGYEIFKYYDDDGDKVYVDSADLNEYIREVMGDAYSAKDFRTWAGTSLAALALDELGIGDDEQVSQTYVRQAVERVAERLGNTPAIARDSYIDPRVIDTYLDGRTLSHFLTLIQNELEKGDLTGPEERAIMKMLESRVDRERAAKV